MTGRMPKKPALSITGLDAAEFRSARRPSCYEWDAAVREGARRHDRVHEMRRVSILTRKRFQLAGALVIGALLPWAVRAPLPGELFEATSVNGLVGNSVAIMIAFWMRLTIETYPG